jgi:hypothetical protein
MYLEMVPDARRPERMLSEHDMLKCSDEENIA